MMYALRFSKLEFLPSFVIVFMIMRLVSYGLVAIKFIIDFFNNKYKGYFIWIVIMGLFMAFISYRSRTINYLTYYIYIVVGKDVNYLKIIKIAFFAIVSSCLIVIALYLFKFIDERYKVEGGRPRHSLGFKDPPMLSNLVFYSILYYIYIRKDKLKNVEIITLFIINTIIFLFTWTRSAYALGTLAVAAVTIINNTKFFKGYKNWYSYILYILPVVLPVFILVLTILYTPENVFLLKFNSLLSGRLALGHKSLFTHGVKFFGQYIKLSGDSSTGIEYNIVDSAYVAYLLILGIIFFILMIVFLEYFGRIINKKRDVYLFIIFVIILCHSTFDAQLFQMSDNYFMFLWSYINS